MDKHTVLVTGGTGYIGSHTAVCLIEKGYKVVVVDNLANSKIEVLERIEKISGVKPEFHKADLTDPAAIEEIFKTNSFDSIIHFAGYKCVGESVEKPHLYYLNNVGGSTVLMDMMARYNVHHIVFSSSCTVYGNPKVMPVTEESPLAPQSPYGLTKLTVENLLNDFGIQKDYIKSGLLRYFNPIGAHESGLIGEDPLGIPNCVMPYIAQVAVKRRDKLSVFGNDYSTKDGTGVRDYLHVQDLAEAHVLALEAVTGEVGNLTCNFGTGVGYSVMELLEAFEKVSGVFIPYEITERRSGDVAEVYADTSYAQELLGWKARRGLEDMCRDHWNWQNKNPNGYE